MKATQRVRFDPAMIEEKIRTVPSSFTLQARNPAKNLKVGDGSLIFAATGGPAFAHDLDRGRRAGNYQDMCDYIQVVQTLNVIHQEGGCPCEPTDLPAEIRAISISIWPPSASPTRTGNAGRWAATASRMRSRCCRSRWARSREELKREPGDADHRQFQLAACGSISRWAKASAPWRGPASRSR